MNATDFAKLGATLRFYEESKHPRDGDGRWESSGGNGGAKKAKPSEGGYVREDETKRRAAEEKWKELARLVKERKRLIAKIKRNKRKKEKDQGK